MSDTPQLEDGYTRIANEIMDALIACRIPGEERQCLDFIIRKTYGYNKKEDIISNSQFVAATGMKKGNVSRAVKNLISKNIVIKSDNKYVPTYRFNKNYKTWKVLSKLQPVINMTTGVIKSDNKVLSKVMDTKERKTILQKKDIKNNFKFFKKVPLPKDIFLSDKMKAYVKSQGCDNSNHAEQLFEDFKINHLKRGTKWVDWTAAFYTWVRNDKKWNPDKYIKWEMVEK